ncbi:uncharacterized protein A4U43_C08F15480 [Asparagus officinalis]|uniref:uncharacterized protein LOC109820412 n=1 Tax=Asparagus officinalis TaxID=4686 RepID=UPI00098E6811|nr:uncharacterized protein LOC109820412 [Asparagus officinalis]ONK60203.1 uncharacterized protein A4U43_C08F15480 [Asparagus officinalis]
MNLIFGEKAQDTKWPEHVEVKGKVRLQAFEKFIQELPRSRNRALMVISLCWKPGSPEAGLAGMKEVAKGYIQSQKVGFAQICPGLDLYVCPRNDTIITILAKHGFFKGMGAVEDNQDSLIGCVIWRRGHTSSNPVPKISEKKETQLPETSSSSTQVDNLKNKQEKALSPLNATLNSSKGIISDSSRPYSSPLIQVQPPAAQKLESNSSQETMIHPDIPITQAVEPKELVAPVRSRATMMLPGAQHQTNTQTNDGSQKFRNHNSYVPRPELGASISSNFTFIGAQIPTSQNTVQSNAKPELAQPALPRPPPLPSEVLQRIVQFNSEANKAPTEGMTKAEASFMPTGEPKETDRACEVHHKPGNLDDDDDDDGDLPEFDFASACGVPKAPMSTFRRSVHQKYQQIGSLKNENVSLGRSMNTYLGSNSTIPTGFGEVNSEKKPADAPSSSHHFPGKSDEGFLSSSISQKSRWDDDDDMPEWCPPDLEHLDGPKASPSTRILPTVSRPISENVEELPLTPTQCSMTTFNAPIQSRPSIQRQSFPGYHPRGFVPIDVRPPQRPHSSNLVRPQFKNFGGKYPSSVSWQWKRD